ncbi:MAG: diaminopimelate epimerase [Desulfobacterales bacterium]|nr:diaminopimelate epimerase [Desulfobacteraceae bacterium]MBT7084837.1 diaminopimelate epimerase [Desulfobacterales bacterium]MBT7696923.1 diaminopimelate epimerase [Desulfobacterales bacterium]
MRFYKYHGLGNDYIVLNPDDIGSQLSESSISLICHRNFGIGSDGILFGPFSTPEGDFSLQIFNPDGSEAEKSGNGLRIFSRYLWDMGMVTEEPFNIVTKGGIVKSRVTSKGKNVSVDMGMVSFESKVIPVNGPSREVINEIITIGGEDLVFCAATIGNPHCVFLRDEISEVEAKKWGPVVENDSRFPNRVNVQFMKILDRSNIQIEIWERGAGYTLASGSSSSAAAAVAYRLGLCDSHITVHMPGGSLQIKVAENLSIFMSGPVTKVAEGNIFPEMFN